MCQFLIYANKLFNFNIISILADLKQIVRFNIETNEISPQKYFCFNIVDIPTNDSTKKYVNQKNLNLLTNLGFFMVVHSIILFGKGDGKECFLNKVLLHGINFLSFN
jgi:hypothetical protein